MLKKRLCDLQTKRATHCCYETEVMSPTSKLEQVAIPQQFDAVRRSNRSQTAPRAIRVPYTSVAASSSFSTSLSCGRLGFHQ
eukprot:4158022-Amphidinium_carterae.2